MKTLFLRMAVSGSLTAAAAFGNRSEKVLDPRARLAPAQLSACSAGGGSALTPNSSHPRGRDAIYLAGIVGLMKLNWNGDFAMTCTMTWPQAIA